MTRCAHTLIYCLFHVSQLRFSASRVGGGGRPGVINCSVIGNDSDERRKQVTPPCSAQWISFRPGGESKVPQHHACGAYYILEREREREDMYLTPWIWTAHRQHHHHAARAAANLICGVKYHIHTCGDFTPSTRPRVSLICVRIIYFGGYS